MQTKLQNISNKLPILFFAEIFIDFCKKTPRKESKIKIPKGILIKFIDKIY